MSARGFVPEPPYSVVPFTGVPCEGERPRMVTDWHVVDGRGRTVHIERAREGWGEGVRRQRADRVARRLNGTLGALGTVTARRSWFCRLCGMRIGGPKPHARR